MTAPASSSRATEPTLWYEPRLTLLAKPAFTAPDHLPVNYLGDSTDGERLAEFAGRLCYMSQKNPASRATREYLENIKKQGHGSVLEHANYSFALREVSRVFTHELVRHRAGSAFSQESLRYVRLTDIGFRVPPALEPLREQVISVVEQGRDNLSQLGLVTLVGVLIGGEIGRGLYRLRLNLSGAERRQQQRTWLHHCGLCQCSFERRYLPPGGRHLVVSWPIRTIDHP